MRTMHLFAGAGGGVLADLILGHSPVVAVEWKSYPAARLYERATEGWFPNMEVFCGDVREFDPAPYKGRVDCIAGGFPCQDISSAGKGGGIGDGTRSGLYREILRCADAIRPKYLFLENSPLIVSRGLEIVLADIASRGYDAEWMRLGADDLGANHKRTRWWLLAKMDDSDGFGIQGQQVDGSQGRKAPGLADNASVFPWWRHDPAEGQIEPLVGRVVDGLAHWLDSSQPFTNSKIGAAKAWIEAIQALGNGQVPIVAAAAFTILKERLETHKKHIE
jgi:DNA (cytosine-5)-methyltransferase 1